MRNIVNHAQHNCSHRPMPRRFKVKLIDDGRVAVIYTHSDYLVASFTLTVEDGRAVLRDSVNQTLSIIPTNDVLVDNISAWTYNRETDELYARIHLMDCAEKMFNATIEGLLDSQHILVPDFENCLPKPPCHHKPTVDGFATKEELATESRIRQYNDDRLFKILEGVDSVSDEFKDVRRALNRISERSNQRDEDHHKALHRLSHDLLDLQRDYDTKILDVSKSINDEISNRQIAINSLTERVCKLEGEDTKINTRIDKVINDARDTEQRINMKFHDLHKEFHAANNNLFKTIKDVEGGLQHQIHDLRDAVVREQSRAMRAENELNKKIENFSGNGGSNVDIETLTNTVDALKNTVDGLKSVIDGIKNQVSELEKSIDGKIEAIQKDVDTKVSDLETNINDIDEKIDALDNSASALTENVEIVTTTNTIKLDKGTDFTTAISTIATEITNVNDHIDGADIDKQYID